ncbi:MAG: PaaI family thioesterase [Lachnospiraceae bacterium]|nr:PaaI family thioesterase [Lachnospiraceae bacterium]
MGTFGTLEEAREFFKGDRFATVNGMQIESLEDGRSVCSMELTDAHQNAMGGVMGGVIFTLADFAFATVVNHNHKGTVAQQVSINYLKAPKKGDRLFAEAKIKHNGRRSVIVNVSVTDGDGRDVAQFIGTGYKLDPL